MSRVWVLAWYYWSKWT